MNLNKSATETVGLLPHILADLRRSGLSERYDRCPPIVITARITETIRMPLGGSIKQTAAELNRYCGL